MKRKIMMLAITLMLLTGLIGIPAQAATPEEIDDAIEAGIVWLAGKQNANGSWGTYADRQQVIGVTGFAVVKLEDRAYELGTDPFAQDYEYSDNVIAGLNYIFSQATTGNCSGVQFGEGHHENYSTAIAMMTIAASRHPERVVDVDGSTVDNWTYEEVLEATVTWFENTQLASGGWGYGCEQIPVRADNSNTGWTVLALQFAETYFGIDVSAVYPGLDSWIDYIQNDTGAADDGGSGYTAPSEWCNLLKTGNLLFEMEFVGDDVTSQRVQDAVDYVERHWNEPNSDPGWRPHHYQAMYCLLKGLESFNIDTIEVGGSPVDWYDEFADAILDSQIFGGAMGDGYWPTNVWGDEIMSTAWALLTLEKVVPPAPEIEVPVDIKPTSCPNPLNVDGQGVLPVAILGTEEFDVSQVDPASVLLEGVSPLHWAMEDVATPFAPFTGKEGCDACTIEGPDGFMDLTLKFDQEEVVQVLGEVEDGQCLALRLTGNLKEEFGGAEIVGEDVVKILKKGNN